MYDFHNLLVYEKAKKFNLEILSLLNSRKTVDLYLKDQLKRASISVVINIAEGSGKFSKPDRKNYYTIARGSTYECVSLLEILKDMKTISEREFQYLNINFEEISKMLLGLIKSQEKQSSVS